MDWLKLKRFLLAAPPYLLVIAQIITMLSENGEAATTPVEAVPAAVPTTN